MNDREHQFKRTLRRWWTRHRRDFPWRSTDDPYAILVSEIMLQQTQTDRVIAYYDRFLKQYPTVEALAKARQAEVVRTWSGLGYNRRAVNLHRAARILNDREILRPLTFDELLRLPGVGDYTARAVLAFAYNKPVAPVDTNIARIYVRHFGKSTSKDLQAFADAMLPRGGARDWSGMLMDFGALVCTSKNPGCEARGLRHIAEVVRKRPQASFKDSDRFWRGRMVDVLRQQSVPLTPAMLRRETERLAGERIGQRHSARILDGLLRDTLAQKVSRRITLA